MNITQNTVKAKDLGIHGVNFQGLNWQGLSTTIEDVKAMRSRTYRHHARLLNHERTPQYLKAKGFSRMLRHFYGTGMGWVYDNIPTFENHFQFRQMNIEHIPFLGELPTSSPP